MSWTRRKAAAFGMVMLGLLAGCQGSNELEELRRENARLRSELQAQEEADNPSRPPRNAADALMTAREGWATHVVRNRETLSGIAEQHYGDPSAWEEIHEANRALIGDDPSRLEVGMTLHLPPRR